MATLASDTFTGSNGTALSSTWTTGYTGTGASTAIQSNKGRFTTGTAGGYAGTARISRKVNITSPTDVVVVGTYTPQGESYPEIYVRASDTVFDTQSGYSMRLPTAGGDSVVKIIEWVAYSGTDLGSASFSASNGTTYGFRFLVIGSTLKARIWNTSGSEPSTWNIEVTDSTISAAGSVGLSVGAGNVASTYVDFDDIIITDGLDASVAPGVILGSASIPSITISAAATVAPDVISGSTTAPSATLGASAGPVPDVISGSTTAPSATVGAGAGPAPDVISGSTTAPSATLGAGAGPAPDVISGSTTAPSATLGAGAGPAPDVISGSTTAPSATAGAGAGPTPDTIAASASTGYGTDSPAVTYGADTAHYTLGIAFKVTSSGISLTKIRLYLDSNGGAVTASSVTNGGSSPLQFRLYAAHDTDAGATGASLITPVNMPTVVMDAWNEATLEAPYDLTQGVVYYAAVNMPLGRYSFKANEFTSNVVAGNITFPANGSIQGTSGTVRNGAFRVGSGPPDQQLNATWYGIDITVTSGDVITMPSATVGAGAGPTPDVINASTTAPSATAGAGAGPTPDVISGSTTAPSATAGAGAGLAPDVINASTTAPSATAGAGAGPAPDVIDGSTTAPSASLTAAASVAPDVIDGSTTAPSASLTAAASVAPDVIDGSTTAPSATAGAGAGPTPDVISGSTTAPSATAGAGAGPTPDVISGSTTAPGVSLTNDANSAPGVVMATTRIPTPVVRAERIGVPGWNTLLSILQEGRSEARALAHIPPRACPNDGEPLLVGAHGGLYCPFDGWKGGQ